MKRSILLTQYLGFTTLGIIMSLAGPLMPAIRSEIPMSYLQAGLVLSGQFLGMLVTVPVGGHLTDRFGHKPFLIVSGLLLALGFFGYTVSSSFATLFASCVVTGIGSGGYDVAFNSLQADNTETNVGRGMNLLHFFFGVGAIAGPLLAALALQTRFGWRSGFAATAILPLAVSVLLFSISVPRTALVGSASPGAIYRSGRLWLFGLVLAIYVGLETSVYNWISTFWQQLPAGVKILSAPLTASLFWIGLTAGRLACGKLTDRIGLLRFIGLASSCTLATSLAWVLFPGPLVTLGAIFLLGAFLAGIFPTTMAFVTGLFPGDSGKVVAFVTVLASVGGFLLPSLLGRFADSYGIGVFPLFVAVLAALMWGGIRVKNYR